MRKKKVDTISGEVDQYQAKPPEPPAHIKLTAEERKFWNSIIILRDFSFWNDSDLENAANLARSKAMVDKLQKEMRKEKEVIDDKMNPKLKVIESFTRQVIALTRLLHLHPEATIGRSKDQAKRNQKHQEKQEQKEKKSSYIAAPVH